MMTEAEGESDGVTCGVGVGGVVANDGSELTVGFMVVRIWVGNGARQLDGFEGVSVVECNKFGDNVWETRHDPAMEG